MESGIYKHKNIGLLGIVFVIVLTLGCTKDQPTIGNEENEFTGNWMGFWAQLNSPSDTLFTGRVWADLVGQGKTISGTATIFYFGFFDTPVYEVSQVSGASENGIDFNLIIFQEEDSIVCVGTLSDDRIEGTFAFGTTGSGGNYFLKRGEKTIWEGEADGKIIYDSLGYSDTTHIEDAPLSIAFTEIEWGDSIMMGGNASFLWERDTFALNMPAEGKILFGDSVIIYFPFTIKDTLGHYNNTLFYFTGYLEGVSDSVLGKWHTKGSGSGPVYPPPYIGLRANGIWEGIRSR
ncbi:hypothetical protein ISS37_07535 [candidate division KSB1 bacterium]|nr:hypothetical protein [candidate division KSB1 bacterium]